VCELDKIFGQPYLFRSRGTNVLTPRKSTSGGWPEPGARSTKNATGSRFSPPGTPQAQGIRLRRSTRALANPPLWAVAARCRSLGLHRYQNPLRFRMPR